MKLLNRLVSKEVLLGRLVGGFLILILRHDSYDRQSSTQSVEISPQDLAV